LTINYLNDFFFNFHALNLLLSNLISSQGASQN
jgi:hypothetical protein